MKPESYLMQERRLLEHHVQAFFGRFETILHEALSPDISADIGSIPPSKERSCHTLVSLGESSAAPNQEQGKSDSIQLLLFLPGDWNPDDRREEQYWPVRLLARLSAAAGCFREPPANGTILKTNSPAQENLPMSHALLLAPSCSPSKGSCCRLPEGKNVHFYQAVPLYPDEAEYGCTAGSEELLKRLNICNSILFPFRGDFLDCDEISQEEAEGLLLDDVSWHLESIQEKQLPADTLSACSHMAAWLHWFQKHKFLTPQLEEKLPDSCSSLREFILEQLNGQILRSHFIQEVQDFADSYYSGENGPCFLSDLEDFAREYGHSADSDCAASCAAFPEEAYLFLPYNDDYINSISRIIEQRWTNWQRQNNRL